MRLAGMQWKRWLLMILALTLPWAGAAAQKPTNPMNADAVKAPAPTFSKLPKLWHSDATKHDFRVEVTSDLFRAEWVNVPPAAAQKGAYIRTECRRAGAKWEGTSHINLPFALSPTVKDTKMCALTVRFEVDSVTPEKITGHSESLHAFDVNTCRVQETKWGDFSWVPKK